MKRSIPVETAARIILSGGVIAYPTEGVYGLGCLPDNAAAVERIIAIKQRRSDAGLILIAGNLAQLEPWIAPTAAEQERLSQHFDWPVTWVVTADPHTPGWLTGGRGTIAVRISNHPLVRQLCAATGSALVSTSANRSGRPAARSALQARRYLGAQLDRVLVGPLGTAVGPSEIRVALSDQVLRPYIGAAQP